MDTKDPRQKTWQLAQIDVDEALKFAEKISDDWYRVQSLAMVAWHTSKKASFMKIVKAALDDARRMPEPNRTVTCSAWVVRAMAQRDDIDILPIVTELLEIIGRETNPVHRAAALLKLFEAVYRKRELRQMALAPLLKASLAMKSWKQPGTLGAIALVLAVDDPEAAEKVVELIGKEPTKRKTIKAIEKREWLGPNEFFPYYTKNVKLNSEAQLVR